MTKHRELYQAAAEAIRGADALLVGAGAGMGVDSGLPDFRGDEGFWKAYPPFRKRGLSFIDLANPQWFESDPSLAWGFYGHRLNLYRNTQPHNGFFLLHKWSQRMANGAFVYTSNVDGQFQNAGYSPEQVMECHGSIHYFQCTTPCQTEIWSSTGKEIVVDEETFCAHQPLPTCHHCQQLARPNILMFGDWKWISRRTREQEKNQEKWLDGLGGKKLVIVECGAGTAVPSVRMRCEQAARSLNGRLIRINPRESFGPEGTLSIPTGALEALQEIDALL